MDRRQFIIAATSACLPNITDACMGGGWDGPIYYYVDTALNAYLDKSKREYKSFSEFLDDQYGKGRWILSEPEIQSTGRHATWNWGRDKWKNMGDSVILSRPSGYFGVNPFRLTLEYETTNADQTEIRYFIEISNPRKMWGIGGEWMQYLDAATLLIDKNIREIQINLALPLSSRVIVTIRNTSNERVLVTQPINCTPLICSGGIPVATQAHADYLNEKECDLVLPDFKNAHIACKSISR